MIKTNMESFFQSDYQFQTVVILGATYTNLQWFSNCEEIHVVDANKELLDTLEISFLGKGFHFYNVVVGKENSQKKFTEYNVSKYNSIATGAFLHELYPGLTIIDNHIVSAKSISSLLSTFKLDEDRSNLLLIDLPGIQFQVINSLMSSDFRHYFEKILCYSPNKPLYEKESNTNSLVSLLEKHSYDSCSILREDDDYSLVEFTLNKFAKKISTLQSEHEEKYSLLESIVDSVEKSKDSLLKENLELKSNLERFKLDLNELKSIKESVTQEKSNLQKKYSDSEQQIKFLNSELKKARDEADEMHSFLQSISERLNKKSLENENLSKLNKGLIRRVEELEKVIKVIEFEFNVIKESLNG